MIRRVSRPIVESNDLFITIEPWISSQQVWKRERKRDWEKEWITDWENELNKSLLNSNSHGRRTWLYRIRVMSHLLPTIFDTHLEIGLLFSHWMLFYRWHLYDWSTAKSWREQRKVEWRCAPVGNNSTRFIDFQAIARIDHLISQ